MTTDAQEFVAEDYYRAILSRWVSEDAIDLSVERSEKLDGRIADRAQLFGMEDYALEKLTLLDGDLSKLSDPSGRYIAAVYSADDYGNPHMDSHWARIGDIITIRYVEEWEYYDPETNEVLTGDLENVDWNRRAKVYRDVEYEVAAMVIVPIALSYRYFGADEFVLSADVFTQDTGTNDIMFYAYDTTDEANAKMESFLQNLTQKIQPQYDYESKETYAESFNSFRDMFAILGGVLCFIIGIVGILNFLNAVLTGIFARRREFAVLQAIGMTGKQLKIMLVWEGLFYTLGSTAVSAIICIVTGPLLSGVLENMFWFFSYHFVITPVLAVAPIFAVLGVALPLVAYHFMIKRSVVERLREE